MKGMDPEFVKGQVDWKETIGSMMPVFVFCHQINLVLDRDLVIHSAYDDKREREREMIWNILCVCVSVMGLLVPLIMRGVSLPFQMQHIQFHGID